MKKLLKISLILALCIAFIIPAVFAAEPQRLAQGKSYRVEDYYYKSRPQAASASSQADLSGAITALHDAIDRVDPSLDISGYGVHMSEMDNVFYALTSNPDFFYFTGLTYNYYNGSGIVVTVTFKYDGVKSDILPMKNLYNQALNQALQIFDPTMSDAEKVLTSHDHLVLHTKYDYENLLTDTIPHVSHSAYGPLVLGVAVCDGYASANKALLSRVGVDIINISSESMAHAWNMVKLGSHWYHIDATFDDPIFDPAGGWYNDNYDLEGYVSHKYFLLSDSKITEYGHFGWSSPYSANSSLYDGKYIDIKSGMFWQNGFWYYNLNGNIRRSDFNLNNATTIKASVNRYDNLFSFIGLYNNRLYYNYTLSGNSKSFIKSIKLDGSDEQDELVIDNTGQSVKEQITELLVLDDHIRYTVCRHINSSNRQYEVRILEFETETIWSLIPALGSTTVIDEERQFIYGLAENLNHSDLFGNYLDFEGNIYLSLESVNGDHVGTGSELKVYDRSDDSLLDSYYILIFGDLNGDGLIDSTDAGKISDAENSVVTWDSSLYALYKSAADLNGDGAMDSADFSLIIDWENSAVTIDQVTGIAA